MNARTQLRTQGCLWATIGKRSAFLRWLAMAWVCLTLTTLAAAGESPRIKESTRLGTGRKAAASPPSRLDSGVTRAAFVPAADAPPRALGSRDAAQRQRLLARYGGNEHSEAAVRRALQWIVDHQLPDGGWSFDHRLGPVVNGRARTSDHPGGLTLARSASTAMALLPLLGAGHTHQQGDYQAAVRAGLDYLIGRQKPDGSWHEPSGTMYSHGLAAIALCEAYGMTRDAALQPSAQGSLNFASYAQDPQGGGWRYSPRQPGDTSVTGWQFAALKSGQAAALSVPPETLARVDKFLGSVEKDRAFYGYTTAGQGPATTAIGILCRMHQGRKRDVEAMQKGVQFLATYGPSTGAAANLYYDFYATQVMWQYGGEPWQKWNVVLRDFLVNSQATDGPEAGSWYCRGGHGADQGGRLYCTSLAALILQVYYRHPPIYASP